MEIARNGLVLTRGNMKESKLLGPKDLGKDPLGCEGIERLRGVRKDACEAFSWGEMGYKTPVRNMIKNLEGQIALLKTNETLYPKVELTFWQKIKRGLWI